MKREEGYDDDWSHKSTSLRGFVSFLLDCVKASVQVQSVFSIVVRNGNDGGWEGSKMKSEIREKVHTFIYSSWRRVEKLIVFTIY